MNRTPKKPGLVIFVAVIMILAGSWNILGGLCGGGAILMLEALPKMEMKGQQDPAAMQRFLTKEVPGYYPVVFGLLAVDLFLGIVKIAAGIGLLRLSSTARMITMLLVALNLLLTCLGAAYNVVFLIPAQGRFIEAHPGPENAMTQPIAIGSLVVSIVIQLAIAAAILIILNTKTTKDAFLAASQPPPVEDDDRPRSRYEGYDDDRPTETGITEKP